MTEQQTSRSEPEYTPQKATVTEWSEPFELVTMDGCEHKLAITSTLVSSAPLDEKTLPRQVRRAISVLMSFVMASGRISSLYFSIGDRDAAASGPEAGEAEASPEG